MLAIIHLAQVALDQSRELEPRFYLKAEGEILFAMICVCGVITLLFGPSDYYKTNMIVRMMGYNNPCVVWDSAPAIYLAATVFPLTVYCAIRYSLLACSRVRLTRRDRPVLVWVSIFVNILYPISQAVCGNIFVVTPLDGSLLHMRMHMTFFLQLVPMRFIVVLVNYWDSSTVTWSSYAYLVLYGVCSAAYASGATATMVLYKNDAVQVLPTTLMQFLDWGWFACLPLTSAFLPAAPVLKIEIVIEESIAIQNGSLPVGDEV